MNKVYCNFITPTIREQAHRLGINPSILNNIISTMKSVNNNPNINTSDNAINIFINNNKDRMKELKLSLPYYKSIPLSTNYNKLTSTIMGSITIRTFNDNFPSSDWINHIYKSEFMLNNLDLFDSPRAIYTYELYLEKLCIENNVDLSKLNPTERIKYIDSAIRALKEVKETYPDEFEIKVNTINIKDGNSNVNVEYKIVSNIKGGKFATIKGNTISIREAVSTNEIRHYLAGDTDEFRKKVMQNLKSKGYNTSSIYEAMGDKNNIAKFLISSMYSHLKNNDAATYNKLDENDKLDIETRATEDGLNSIGIYPNTVSNTIVIKAAKEMDKDWGKTISTPIRSTNIADYVNTEGKDKGFLTKKGEELLSTTFDKSKFNEGTTEVKLYPDIKGTAIEIKFTSPRTGNTAYAIYNGSPTRKTWNLYNSKHEEVTNINDDNYWKSIDKIVPKSIRNLVESGRYNEMDFKAKETNSKTLAIKETELEAYFEKEYNVFMQGRNLDYNTKQINKALSPVQEYSNEEQNIIDKAKKNGTFMKAPNGKPTNLTEKQWIQVRTKAFKDWFGDWENDPKNASKVVDENGEPLVVYHTRDAYKGSDFSVFNTNIENRESAIYTTDSKDMSLSYWKFGKDREILSKLFFYIGSDISKMDEDPFTGEAILNSQYQKLIKILKELGITNIKDSYTKEELNDIYNNLKQKEKEKDIKDLFINLKNPIIIEGNNSQWNDINYQNKTVSTRDIENMYRNSNYDGIIFKNIKDWGDMTEDGNSANVFAVYKPNQVKSAINNTGVFSKDSNDIYDTDSKEAPIQDSNKNITIKGINFITTPSKNYADRTKANAEWSDITIALAEDFNTAGEKLTKTVAGNKYVSANISNDVSTIVNNIYNQLVSKGKTKDIKLNIAGNGIYSLKDTQSQYDVKLIDIIKGLQAKGITISEIRSGGQTGIDEAGAKAGQFLNIKTTITSTSDFKFRNKQGVDISNEQAFKARFASTNKYVNHYTGNIINDGNTIFVFGSNPEGRHGAGAAKVAREQFGAKYGVGEGITGNSYALPTKDLRVKVNNGFRSISPKDIINNIKKLYETAKSIPNKQFKIAYRNGRNKRTLNGYTGEELVSFFKAAGELPKNIQISEEWSKYWNDVQPYDVTKDTVEISGPVTIDISKEDNDNIPMIGEQGNLVLDTESPYVRMSRVFTATELTDRTNDIAREFSSQLDSLYEDLLDEYENRIAEASTTEDKRKLEQDLALLKEDNGRKIAINKIGFSVIVDNIKASYSDVLDYDDETIREIYNTDPNIIRTKIQNTLDYFEYLLEDACNIIEMNERIRITIDKHMFNDGTKDSEIIDGGITDTEKEINDEDEQIGDNENGEAVSGNDGWSFKVREVSPHDSISKGTKSVLRDIKKIRPDGSVDVDDLGKVRYVREDIAHATLINALSDMIDPDDFSKLENGNYRLLALERVAQKYPWVNQVIDKLLEEPRLISLFYTDFRKDFISYWTQKYNKDKGLIENIPLNQSVAIDSTITDVIRNYENKDMMSEDSIYDSNGKIVKENADKGINNVDKAFKLIKTLDEDELDNIYKYINDSLRMIGFNTRVNDVSYLYDNVNGRNNLITLVRNLREIFEKAKNLGENEHLIDSLKEQYKNLAELVGTVTELDNIQSFRVNGKSYYSYSAPNYVNTQIKTFLNDAKRQNYLDTEFKAYNWFYNKDNKTWKNEWLRQIESDADVRNHIAIKEINVLDKDSYNDWKPNQIKEAFLEEYLSIPENKGSKKQYAWYNFPIFSDSPVAMFIRFTKYIDDNEGTFKQKLLPLFRQIVYQEIERIKLCEDRDKPGVMKIQNFDKRGKIFNFFPELNTNKYGKSQISFKEAIQYYADDKEGLDRFIDMAINEIMDKNFEEFLKSYNNDDLLAQVKRTGVVTTDEAALNKLEEYFWNQSFATSQIIQITTTDLAYYKDGVDFQKRYKEIYAAGSKLNTNSKYGRKIERTIYLKDNIITSANYTDIKSNIMQAVKEKRLSREEGLAILDKFKDINQTDAQAYRSLSSYRAVLDMMGLWTDDMQRAFDNLQKGIYDSRDFDIVWQTIKPFVFTQIDKNDGLGGHIKVPHQNKNSEFLLLAAYDILNSVMSKSPKFVGLNRFMEDKGIDVIQFESAVKAGGEGIVDISVSQNKVNKVVRDQAITLGNITIPLEGVKDWKTIKKAFDDALDNNNISQDDYNTVMKYFEPTSDEVYEMLNNAACKPVLDTDIIEDGYNTSVVHSIPYKDYVVQTPTPEHLFDASSIYGSQYRNLILSDIPDDMEITINSKTFKGKEIKNFYNSLIIENLLEDFRNIRGYFDSIQDLQKELLSMVKGNPKYGRDMLNALQIVKRNINGVEREVFNLPLHNPSTTTKIQELVNSIFKNHITKQKIKGGKATLASNFGFTRDLKILREEDGSIIGAECYLPFYSKKYFESILVDVKDKEGNIIGQKLDINRLDPELRKLLGFRIPTENLYSMLPMIIKGFLPQQNGSSIMLPADITQIAGEDFD